MQAGGGHSRSPALQQFAAVARTFCETVDLLPTLGKEEFLARIYELLPLLLATASKLTLLEPRSEHPLPSLSDQHWLALEAQLKNKLGDDNLYWTVYDPREREEPVAGSLADDIADICSDLEPGIRALDHNSGQGFSDVEFEWRLGFETHWGKHAARALLVIHHLVNPGTV